MPDFPDEVTVTVAERTLIYQFMYATTILDKRQGVYYLQGSDSRCYFNRIYRSPAARAA